MFDRVAFEAGQTVDATIMFDRSNAALDMELLNPDGRRRRSLQDRQRGHQHYRRGIGHVLRAVHPFSGETGYSLSVTTVSGSMDTGADTEMSGGTDADSGTSSGNGPGFGAVVALVALLPVGAFAHRRR